jgi:hypothetical protein
LPQTCGLLYLILPCMKVSRCLHKSCRQMAGGELILLFF